MAVFWVNDRSKVLVASLVNLRSEVRSDAKG